MTAKHGIPWLNVCACPGKHHSSDCKAPRGMTWNPIRGCTKTDRGCKNCYAILDAARLVRVGRGPKASAKQRATGASYAACLVDKEGSPKNNWNGHVELVPEFLARPLSRRKPRTVFVNSMSDLFHPKVPFEFIAAVFAVMAATVPKDDADEYGHEYIVLTKRPERALEWFAWFDAQVRERAAIARADAWVRGTILSEHAHKIAGISPCAGLHTAWPLPNVTIGVSISDQETADRLLPLLARVPAKTRAVSAEPLLRQVDISRWLEPRFEHTSKHCDALYETRPGIDWLIIGAESGEKRRKCELAHVQNLAAQVLDAQAPYATLVDDLLDKPSPIGPALYVKQWDVCLNCAGSGHSSMPDQRCVRCHGTGQTGKLRKDCPALHIPGHGAQQWRQFPVGWRS